MSTPESWLAFGVASLLVILVPGPAMLLVLAQLGHSRARAWATVGGLVLGDLVLITAAGLGLASLLRGVPELALALRGVGAAYVAWLGLSELRRPPGAASPAPVEAGQGLRAAVLLTVMNPKPVLFFAAFFPLFLPAGTSEVLPGFLRLGAVFELLNFASYGLLITAAGWVRHRWRAPAWLPRASGLALLGCALLVLRA